MKVVISPFSLALYWSFQSFSFSALASTSIVFLLAYLFASSDSSVSDFSVSDFSVSIFMLCLRPFQIGHITNSHYFAISVAISKLNILSSPATRSPAIKQC